mmetsp:Transcript_16196/g.29479  ORF Transcript_16196/g.29479 Transcript_16196/m.29479 type:complete len:109 (+) Transcript_16196:63-389(+)
MVDMSTLRSVATRSRASTGSLASVQEDSPLAPSTGQSPWSSVASSKSTGLMSQKTRSTSSALSAQEKKEQLAHVTSVLFERAKRASTEEKAAPAPKEIPSEFEFVVTL